VCEDDTILGTSIYGIVKVDEGRIVVLLSVRHEVKAISRRGSGSHKKGEEKKCEKQQEWESSAG
jgi:hypothetical protein